MSYVTLSCQASNITRCQVSSRFRAWFQDSEGNIDFLQMTLSQTESTILHESMILHISPLRHCYSLVFFLLGFYSLN